MHIKKLDTNISLLIGFILTCITFFIKSDKLSIYIRVIICLLIVSIFLVLLTLKYYVLYFETKLTVNSLNDRLNFAKIKIDQVKIVTDAQDSKIKELETSISDAYSKLNKITDELNKHSE